MNDLFSNNPDFTVESLTDAINIVPYIPTRLGSLNLFRDKYLISDNVNLEYKNRSLHIIPSTPRGAPPPQNDRGTRDLYGLKVPHYPIVDKIMAEEVNGVRAFGSTTELMSFNELVTDCLTAMRQDFEYTYEFLRALALQGYVKDPNTSVIYDLFSVFGISRTTVTITLATANDIKRGATEILRTIADKLGIPNLPEVRVMCSDGFFDALIADDEIKEAYDRFQNGQFFRDNQVWSSFFYAGVWWENYRNPNTGVDFVTDNEAFAFPIGIPGLFQRAWAPAEFAETVNTRARPIYVKTEPMRYNVGQEVYAQTNVLHYCTRPAACIKVVKA